MNQLTITPIRSEIVTGAAHVMPALIAAAGAKASTRFLEFFAAQIGNPHTRRAYGRAVADFLAWCDDNGVALITAVQPLHVAAWVEMQQQDCAAPRPSRRDWPPPGSVARRSSASMSLSPDHETRSRGYPPFCVFLVHENVSRLMRICLRDRANLSPG